jgi:hypothetical protein
MTLCRVVGVIYALYATWAPRITVKATHCHFAIAIQFCLILAVLCNDDGVFTNASYSRAADSPAAMNFEL